MTRIKLLFLIMILTLFALAPLAIADGTARTLDGFGDISTPEAAEQTLKTAIEKLLAAGGGTLVIPATAPEKMKVENLSQTKRSTHDEGPAVTIIDRRRGFLTYHLAPIGNHQTACWSGLRLSRMLNLGQKSLPHCGKHANQTIQNYVISGSSSYMATLTDPVKKGKDIRCYVDTIRGIWVGQFLNITSSVMGYAAPYDRITVKSIGWDNKRKRNYFTADLEHDHPLGALVYNKHVVNGLQMEGYSNCDNQTPGELSVVRRHYGVGDCFVISAWLRYMSDIFSGFGDEGAVVINAETIGDLNFFASSVESVDWSKDQITYAPGLVNPHTLSNSRPLINMNETKWITQGAVRIVPPWKTYQGKTYPGKIGGPGNVFNYQGGLILGSTDCPWTDEIVGRFFTITEPTEIISPDDKSSAGGYAKLPTRPVYRWYRIMDFRKDEDGTKVIKILRVRWSAVAAGAPSLFLDENYTWDDHDRPLRYAIAPGAWVYDISQGWADAIATGGRVGKEAPRKLRIVPHADRGTKFDFEPGDPIEQPVGPDPYQPRPIRIRQFDQLPSTMPSASIEVKQMGRFQVPIGIDFIGLITSRDQLEKRKDRKPPYGTVINVRSLAEVGINFASEVTDAAIVFRQPKDRVQPIRWRHNRPGGSSSLTVPPETGDFVFRGGHLDVGGRGVQRLSGISGTSKPAANLRGINVALKEGATELQIAFRNAEADASYAVSVTPSWMTSVCVPEKTAEGFAVRFSTAAPSKAKLDWIIIR